MKNLKILFTLLILVLVISCSKDSDTPPTPVAPVLAITAISPTTGPKNTPVTITGTGFSTTAGNNAVNLNGKVCPVVNSTATQLTITIPLSAGSGKIKVAVAAANAESGNFDFVVTTTVTTIAGTTSGFADGQGTSAKFNDIRGLTIDATGNIFVADTGNDRIRKITPSGLVTTIAGSTRGFENGQSILAKFNEPNDVAIDPDGNLYVTDRVNHRIRKISSTGLVSTFAGSIAGFEDGFSFQSKFDNPTGITIDNVGNLFVTDAVNHKIRKITQERIVSTLAGSSSGSVDGLGSLAKIGLPKGIVINSANNLFIADNFYRIRSCTQLGQVTTFAGSTEGFADGQGTSAKFQFTFDLTIDSSGNLYVPDGHRIRKISATGLVSTIAGNGIFGFADGIGSSAQFSAPLGITIDNLGNLFLSDSTRIRKITFD